MVITCLPAMSPASISCSKLLKTQSETSTNQLLRTFQGESALLSVITSFRSSTPKLVRDLPALKGLKWEKSNFMLPISNPALKSSNLYATEINWETPVASNQIRHAVSKDFHKISLKMWVNDSHAVIEYTQQEMPVSIETGRMLVQAHREGHLRLYRLWTEKLLTSEEASERSATIPMGNIVIDVNLESKNAREVINNLMELFKDSNLFMSGDKIDHREMLSTSRILGEDIDLVHNPLVDSIPIRDGNSNQFISF